MDASTGTPDDEPDFRLRRLSPAAGPLPGPGAQVPSHAFRADRPGGHDPDARQRLRGQAHPAGLDAGPACAASARPPPPASSPAASTTPAPACPTPGRPSICRNSASTARRSWNPGTWTCWRWTPPLIRHRRRPGHHRRIRYGPVSARYKVYIVDEVHMLSEKAFNAFLKTLEGSPRPTRSSSSPPPNPQGPRHDPLALPALRPAAGRGACLARPPRPHLRSRGCRRRGGRP